MRLALVLHLYQPPTQTFEELKVITTECYLPLFKLLRSNKHLKITLNVPLSVLELFETNGYSHIISSIKELLELERIEIVGTGAYHPLLTKISKNFREQQIVLQEFALGYYLGRRKGFEGDNSVMYKDLKGFFPPELAVNADLIETLSDFGYEWCIVDQCAVLPALTNNSDVDGVLFQLDGLKTKLVVRDTELSNMLAFKRNTSVNDLFEYMSKKKNREFIVALDAEFFGHHYKQGLYVLDFLSQEMDKLGGKFETVSNIVDDFEPMQIKKMFESSWGATSLDVTSGIPYPFWSVEGNENQENLWKLTNKVQELNQDFFKHSFTDEDFQNVPVWVESAIAKIPNKSEAEAVTKNLLINKVLHSDQYWWVSKRDVAGTHLYNTFLVRKALSLYKQLLEGDEEALGLIQIIDSNL